MILERRVRKQNLHKLDILIQDTTNEFLQILDIPDTLPEGRSSFLINGSPFLKLTTDVLVEILDRDNNTVFVNPVFDPHFVAMEGTARAITTEIYQSTPGGRALLTVVGELDHTKFLGEVPLTPDLLDQLAVESDPLFTGNVSFAQAVSENYFIPEEFRGVYNVKYTKVLHINPKARNTQPIKFYRAPQIQAREIIRTEVSPSESIFIKNVVVSDGQMKGSRVNPSDGSLRLVDPAEIAPVRSVIACDNNAQGTNKVIGTIYNRQYPITLTSADSFGSIIRRDWEFGDPHVTASQYLDTLPAQTYTYTKAGIYNAKLVVHSPTGQYDLDRQSITISNPPAPVADFTSLDPTTNTGETVKITGSMEDPNSRTFRFKDTTTNVVDIVDPLIFGTKFSNLNDTEYSWSFGDGNTFNGIGNTARNPENTYVQSGSYNVALTVKNAYGTQTNTKTSNNHILIQPSLPTVDFSVDSGSISQAQALSAASATVQFTNNSVYYGDSISYAWTFNSSGSTSTAVSPTCIYTGSYAADTTFNVTLTATDNFGRSVTVTKPNMISITPSIPVPDFSANIREFTLGLGGSQQVQFTDESTSETNLTYDWYFNGATTGSSLLTSNSSTIEGGLTGTVWGNGASDGATLDASTATYRSGNKSLRLRNLTAADLTDVYTFGYDIGNSGISDLNTWKAQYSLADITQGDSYTMEFWAKSDLPWLSPTILAGMFGANANGNIFGAGPTEDTWVIKEFPVTNKWQKYNFTFTFKHPNSKYLTTRLGVNELGQGSGHIYFDDIYVYKANSTLQNPKVTYRSRTDGSRGTVRLSVTNTAGIERSETRSNYINTLVGKPSASFTIDDTTVQTQVPITFNGAGSDSYSPIQHFRWNWGDGTFDNIYSGVETATHKYTTAGTYTPKLTVYSADGTSTEVSVGNVTISAPPAPTVALNFSPNSYDQSQGETPHEVEVEAVISGQATASNITFGQGDRTNSRLGFTVYDTPGTYTITATASGPGGSNSATKTITVSAPPVQIEPVDEIEDPDPNLFDETLLANQAGSSLGAGSGTGQDPPSPYGSGGGGGSPGCVLAGTILRTSRGEIPVEEVTVDDLLLSYNFDSKEFDYYKIESAWSTTQPTRVFVETENGKSVECSDTHLFYHPDYKNQEICVKDLNVGDIVYTIDDDENVIEDPIRNITIFDEEVTVYNFKVPVVHSYITNNIISHNAQKSEPEGNNPYNMPYFMNLASPETENFVIEATGDDSIDFTRHMLGGTLQIFPNTGSTDMDILNSNTEPSKRYLVTQQPLVTKIRKIKTNKTIVPDVNGLIVQNRLDKDKGVVFSEYQDFGASSYSMSFQRPVTASFRVINKKSFAKINLTQLRTYSGDVSRVKVYYQTAAQSGYNLIGESVLQAPEILADPGVRFGKKKIGYFSDQGHLDYYWYSREGFRAGFWGGVDSADSVFGWNTPTASLTHQKTPYIDTMKISGSNYNYNEVVGLFHKFPMRLVAGVEYTLRFQLSGIKKKKQLDKDQAAKIGASFPAAHKSQAKIRFYVSGSSLKATTPYGYDLGYAELESAVSESYDYVEHNFRTTKNGDGRLQLVAESGEWYINDLSIKPARESGFSPDFSSLVVPVPELAQKPSDIEFYAEFFDLNSNVANILAIGKQSELFQGSSLVIEGTDNTISGSLFLGGDTEGSGIEVHGGSSYIRNIGYLGYNSASMTQTPEMPERGKAGFMLWSGSLLTDITDEYNLGDVGFELHGGPGVRNNTAGAMRFRSSTGRLEVTGSIVATDGHFARNFSVGTGSEAIEISSSKFIMKTKNWNHPTSSAGWAISGSGEAFFQEGQIGGWQLKTLDRGTVRERAVLSGSNITLDAGGAALYMSNKGPGSDQVNQFTTLADEYYLDFTPSQSEAIQSSDYYVSFGPKFKVDKDGTLFASGAKFVGTITASAGLLGGFNIGSASMYAGAPEGSPNFFLSGSATGNSGKSSYFISSSRFQVTAEGDITGSQVLFTSGKIGGWSLSTTLSATNILLDPATPKITLGDKLTLTDSNSGFYAGTDGIALGANSVFKVTSAGALTATNATITGNITAQTGTIGGFNIGTDLSNSAGGSNALVLKGASGQITASNVLFSGGKIGGWSLATDGFSSDSGELQITGSTGQITGSQVLFSGGTIGGFTLTSTALTGGSTGTTVALTPGTGIHMGHATFGSAPFSVTNAGVLTATLGQIAGFTIATTGITSTGIGVHPSGQTHAFTAGTSNEFSVKHSGQVSGSNVNFTGGRIGGWVVSNTQITSSGLVLDSTGDIRSANFQPRLTGWRVSSQGNGTAEFENVRIRGTLATTTFEKETVNAVGGQLWVGNSSVMSESISSVQTNILIENVSGFQKNEVLIVKKTNPTGFTKEYMLVTGSKRINEASDTDFSGHLHVTRGYGSSTSQSVFLTGSLLNEGSGISTTIGTFGVDNFQGPTADAPALVYKLIKIDDEKMFVTGSTATTISVERGVDGSLKATHTNNAGILVADDNTSFLSGLVSPQESYDPGQVIVSSGRYIGGTGSNTTGSGYIRLNANPKDGTTPFIDFVERTGSGIYDVQLRARLGDLSGLVNTAYGTAVAMPKNPGFGLASENVFLKGTIKATSGSIAGIKMESGQLFSGEGSYYNSNTPFYLSGKGDATAGDFSLGNKLKWDASTSTLTIAGQITLESGGGFDPDGLISGSAQIAGDISGSIAGQTGSLDTGISNAQSTADTGVANAATAQAQANTATTNAATAQSAIDTMETQVVLDSNGMGLWNAAGSVQVAEYGTTTTFYDGVGHAAANKKTELNASGITFWGDTVYQKATLNSSGLTIYDDRSSVAVDVANFGATVRVGEDETDKSALRVAADGSISIGVKDGTPKFSVAANGNVSVEGTITIGANSTSAVDFGAGAAASASAAQSTANTAETNAQTGISNAATAQAQANTATTNAATAQSAIDTMETQVVLDSGGMELRKANSKKVAKYGTTTYFYDGTDSEVVKLQLQAAGVTAYGDDTNTYSQMTSAGMTIFNDGSVADPNTGVAHFGTTLRVGPHHASKSALRVDNSGNLTIGTSGTSNVSMTNTGVLTVTGTVNASGGTFTGNVDVDGTLTAGTAKFGENVASTNDGLWLDADNYWYDSGVMKATSGTVGGWTMTDTKLQNATNLLTLDSQNPKIYVGSSGGSSTSLFLSGDGLYRIWIGGTASGSAPFRVHRDGTLTATGVDITGNITATTGTFTGTVNASGGTFTGRVRAGDAYFGVGADGGSNDGIYLNSNNYWYDTGTIKAQDGTIGGFTLGSSKLTTTGGANDQSTIGFGISTPESKLHVIQDATDSDTFTIGSTPSWECKDGKTAWAARIGVDPYTGGTANNFYQGAIGMLGIKDSYRIRNFGLYMETIQGQNKGWAGSDIDVSGSYGYGVQFSFASSKVQYGVRSIQAFGPGQGTAGSATGEIMHIGALYDQGDGLDVQSNTRTWTTSGGLMQRGVQIVCKGNYDVAITSHPTNASNAMRDLSYVSALSLNNLRTGTNGQSAGHGIFATGSQWKHFIGASTLIGDPSDGNNKTPSYTLDVRGDIRATGNITAYSDIRDKENIETISGSLGIINDIRGVKFDWNEDYKFEHRDRNKGSDRYIKALASGSAPMLDPNLEGRQIGVIAQEIESVLPELVFEDDRGRKNVSYSNLTAVLIEAVKEQQEQIEELKQEIKEIKDA